MKFTHPVIGVGFVSDGSEQLLQIPLDVAVDGALDRIEVSSEESWTGFCRTISAKLKVPVSQLDLAWKLSFEPKNAMP